MMSIHEILEEQRRFFRSGATLSVKVRLEKLRKLYSTIQAHEEEISRALEEDLGKSDFEGFMCEIGMMLSEISFLIKNTPKYAREKKVPTPMSQFAAKSYIKPVPYGNVLIMSPWNYPFLLTMEPLADAIAAGNTAIVKPSAYSPATGKVVEKIIRECFPREYVAVVTGGRKENAALLEEKFDLVFFTGSQAVGKEVLRRCAEHLTPAVLELGGKSPCIVDSTAKIPLAARRIVFGKFLNCGQTCVAPDFVLCHSSVKEEFVQAVKEEIREQFGERPLENPDYGHIINEKHFDRLCGLVEEKKVVCGGDTAREKLKIAPTVMDGVTWEDKIMQEEIFGPILPILTYEKTEELYEQLLNRPKPLALYLFTEDRRLVSELTARLPFGGGCINDTIIHLATSQMPFGGVGESGMGSYHGKSGFDAFSHKKAIVDKKTWMDMKVRYQPYDREKDMKMLKSLMK